jgi:protein-S-isoprenylcysteine O-methyltransferase Ste14
VLLFGALGRLWCFRTLGRMFTFELAVRDDHALVTTGPYAYVRHPSYTAGICVLLGFPLVHLAPGAWARECALATHAGWFWAAALYLATSAWVGVGAVMRGPVEDAKMRERFGERWLEYRRRVRWGYVPFVY